MPAWGRLEGCCGAEGWGKLSLGPELGSEVGPQVPTRVSLLTHQTGPTPNSSSHTLGLKGSRSDTYYQQPENRFPKGHGFLQQVAPSAGSILTRSLGRTPAPSANTGCRTPGKPGPSYGAGEMPGSRRNAARSAFTRSRDAMPRSQ